MQENLKQIPKIFYKKKLFILVSLFICLFSFMSLGASAETPAALAAGQPIATAFPDPEFRKYVCKKVLGKTAPSEDSTYANANFAEGDAEKIAARTNVIPRYTSNLSSFEGIEYFTGMTSFNCDSTGITELNLSSNTALTSLDCRNCSNLTSLDVSGCPELGQLICYRTEITELNLSSNTALTDLDCDSTGITELNLSSNTALTDLDCSATGITELDVSKCSTLSILRCNSCSNLTSLNVNGRQKLSILECNSCSNLTSLVVKSCPKLDTLKYNGCSSLENLNVSGCTSLTNLDCSNFVTITSLDVSGCTALTDLDCGNTGITELNLSSNTALTNLGCGNTGITELNLSSNTALTDLYCGNTGITELNLSSNTALIDLNCSHTGITELNLSSNTALTDLYCGNTGITSLDVSSCTALTNLDCSHCEDLRSINVDGCKALKRLDFLYSSNLTSLDVSDCTALEKLDCTGTRITELDVSKCSMLKLLYVGSTEITSLDVSGSPALNYLDCGYSESLASLNVSDCTRLTQLRCFSCKNLASLNVSGCTSLEKLECYFCGLNGIDLSSLENLSNVDLRYEQTVPTGFSNKNGIRYINGPAISSDLFSDFTIYSVVVNGASVSNISNYTKYDAENKFIKILSKDVNKVSISINVIDGKNSKYRMDIVYVIQGGKVTYDANGGTFVNGKPAPVILDFGADISEYVPTANEGIYEVEQDGLDFAGWCKEPDVDIMDDYGVNVYAKWSERIYLTFNLNYSGANVPQLTINGSTDTTSVLENGKLKVIEDAPIKEIIDGKQIAATRPGYTFKGWTLDSLGKRPITEETTMLPRDMTLFAQWEANTYTLTVLANVDPNDENQPDKQSLTLEIKTDEKILAAIEKKYGEQPITCPEHRIKGWTEDAAGEGKLLNTAKVMPAQDLTIYAKWRRFSSTMNEELYIADVFIDDNFRSYIYSYIFGKTEPEEEENFTQEYMDAIRNATYINISNRSISDLAGLSNFENLITLECNGNNITELDVSKIKTLKYLGCSSNPIKNLSLGETPILNRLTIYSCDLNELDVSKYTELTNLLCYSNNLSTLDVSKNTKLKFLECQNNKLEALDLSNNIELTNLDCSNNAINKIDLTSNTKLETANLGPQTLYLEVSKNEGDSTYAVLLGQGITMSEEDLIAAKYSSETGKVTWNNSDEVDNFTYNCNTNNGELTMEVNIYSMVPVILNTNGGTFTTTGETDNKTVLYKVKTPTSGICNEITNNSNYAVDSGSDVFVAWRPTCEALNGDGCELIVDWVETIEGQVFKEVFPDTNFRNFVINKVLVTEVGISDNSLITANHQQMLLTVSQLDVRGKAIKSLEGIKYFANLRSLNCSNNSLQELDLSGFEVLKECNFENQTANVILSKDENEQWQVKLPKNLETVNGLIEGTYDQATGLVTWNQGKEYNESFTYNYNLIDGFGTMTVTVKPSMSLKFDADGGKFRNGTPEDIAVPYGAKIKDYISSYDRKTYEPINDDTNKLFSSWSLTSSSVGEQTKITDENLMNAQEVTLYAIWKSVVEKIEEVTKSDLSAVTLIQASDPSKDEGDVNNMSTEDKTAVIAETLGKTENKETYTQAVETVSLYLNNVTQDTAMDEGAKEQVEIIKNAIAQANHKDTTNKVSVSAADENSELDWDIKLNVEPKEIVKEDLLGQDDDLDAVLSSGSALISFDISLAKVSINDDGVLDEAKYEPEAGKKVTLIVPSPIDQFYIDFGFNVTYIHFKDDGTKEYFSLKDGTLEAIGNGLLKLTVDSFSEFIGDGSSLPCDITFDLNDGNTVAFKKSEAAIYDLVDNEIYAALENGLPKLKGLSVLVKPEFKVSMLSGTIDGNQAIRGVFDVMNRTAIEKAPAGKMFYKWNTKSDGTGVWLEPGSEAEAFELLNANGDTTGSPGVARKLTLYAIWVLPGDFNGDGVVDEKDLAYITDYYDKYGNNLPSDCFSKGKTDLDDLSVWIQYYGKTGEYDYSVQQNEEQV